MNLRCIVIDDEPLALGLVSQFVKQTPFLELTGEFENALEALRVIDQEKIDLIFLDIQMNDLSGLELAKVLEGRAHKPMIVFTTAFDQFAIEGYKVDAIDYLLKPFNYQEFLRAALKAQSYKKLRTQTGASADEIDYIFLKVEYQLQRVMYQDILYIEGLKDYVKVHLQNKPHPLLSLTSLKTLEEKLPASRFVRIHRSYIVALDKIDAVSKTAVEIDGKLLTISENYRKQFHDQINSGY